MKEGVARIRVRGSDRLWAVVHGICVSGFVGGGKGGGGLI